MSNQQFEKELAEIRLGLDRDLGLKDSSGLVDPLGMKIGYQMGMGGLAGDGPKFSKGLQLEGKVSEDSGVIKQL